MPRSTRYLAKGETAVAKSFDASLKDLIESHAEDWARFLGAQDVRRVRVVDADVATVSAAADKVLVVESGLGEYVLHSELQSRHDGGLPRRSWWYSSVFHWRLSLPVHSVIVLLRPEADGPDLTGSYAVQGVGAERPTILFHYEVLRVWQAPVSQFLESGLGVLPLAPLADSAKGHLPEVLRTIDQRLRQEASVDEANKLRAATTVLLGLRHDRATIEQSLKGLWTMWEQVLEDSWVVQEFIRRGERIGEERGEKRGELRGEQRGFQRGEETGRKIGEERGKLLAAAQLLLRLGEKRFGPPDSQTRAAIENSQNFNHLSAMAERVNEAASWQDLLETPI